MGRQSTPSAADVEWNSFHIRIHTGLGRVYVTVTVTHHRGITTLWRQNLFTVPIEGVQLDTATTIQDVLRGLQATLTGMVERTVWE